MGGWDEPGCVVLLCWLHHRAYDTGRLELLPHLEPDWRDEVAHAVVHLGLIGAVRRLAPGRRMAIAELQGSRIPLIDHPDWADGIDFQRGFG